ncbi:anti-sigma factor [Piscinibacter sp.]|uniref:anti-sigma factor n=1 Tax=Piscinibacter sp. TaxID=1903157 RepID=UPI002C255347|nr:anti-sigma factor [Albitalea sp.]HUG24264.1 anti-sigma factor [Albitalea sp.]
MDYGRPALADRLASEYVLGTLRGPARRRFDALLPAHPLLRQAVKAWEAELLPLVDAVPAVEPPAGVWARVERQLFNEPARAAGWWQRLGLWRGAAGLATTAALILAVALVMPPPAQAPLLVVLEADPSAPSARFVASVSPDGRALVLRPLDEMRLSAAQALELWALPDSGPPRSLGLVSPRESTRVVRAQLLDGTAGFAVSVEPAGGSPTGAPTGPVVSVGKLRL